MTDHLPAEAAEALLELATGGKPRVAQPAMIEVSPLEHPHAKRRFRVMTNVEDLQRALDFPWEKWTVFLHPEQRQWVEHEYAGPARVSGSAGTGKTIVALHRAAHLARMHPDARILLTTFSNTLANALQTKLRRLLGNEPRLAERIDVYSLDSIGLRLYRTLLGQATLASREKGSGRHREWCRGAQLFGRASRSCCAVQVAVGCSVTLKRAMLRRRYARTTNTSKTRNVTVGTVKKSIETFSDFIRRN